MEQHLLSTIDNPFDPFTQWDDWYRWDEAAGYHSLSLLGRIAVYSDEEPLPMQLRAIERAIDEIVKENVTGMFIKVSKFV
jgi:hypothetical protein